MAITLIDGRLTPMAGGDLSAAPQLWTAATNDTEVDTIAADGLTTYADNLQVGDRLQIIVDHDGTPKTLIGEITEGTASTDRTFLPESNSASLPALTDGNVWMGNASNVATGVAITGPIVIDNSGASSISAGSITPPALSSAANYNVTCVAYIDWANPFTHTLYFPMAVTVTGLRGTVVGDIDGANAGTVTAKNNAGTALTAGLLTFTAASVAGTEVAVLPTSNNTFVANEKLQLEMGGTAASGFVNIHVEYVITG